MSQKVIMNKKLLTNVIKIGISIWTLTLVLIYLILSYITYTIIYTIARLIGSPRFMEYFLQIRGLLLQFFSGPYTY